MLALLVYQKNPSYTLALKPKIFTNRNFTNFQDSFAIESRLVVWIAIKFVKIVSLSIQTSNWLDNYEFECLEQQSH